MYLIGRYNLLQNGFYAIWYSQRPPASVGVKWISRKKVKKRNSLLKYWRFEFIVDQRFAVKNSWSWNFFMVYLKNFSAFTFVADIICIDYVRTVIGQTPKNSKSSDAQQQPTHTTVEPFYITCMTITILGAVLAVVSIFIILYLFNYILISIYKVSRFGCLTLSLSAE